MKKIKFIFLVILIIITCTGCTTEYNINIKENTIEEIININDTILDGKTKEDILSSYNKWYPVYNDFTENINNPAEIEFDEKIDGVEYYNKTIKETNNGYNYTYQFIHPINKYKNTNALINSYDNINIFEGNGYLVLKTGKENKLCNDNMFDSLTVNITIDPQIYKLNTTNSKRYKNNTYTWVIDKSNCDDSQILLTIDRKKQTQEENPNNGEDKKNNENKKDYSLYIFLGIIIILILIGYIIFNKIKDKNNKIDD